MPEGNSKLCRFCGAGTAITVSAWPDWATRLIASEMALRTGSRLVSKVRDRILNHLPQWDLSDEFVATRKLQIACKRCHQGGMSRIDAMAKPMALPLIKGETAIIGPSSQAALAAWVAKTVMIAELTSTSGPVTPECERMELRQKQRPPQSWNIWAAFSNGVECEASYVRHTARLSAMQSADSDPSDRPDTQSITFGLGHVLFHVMTSTVSDMKFELPFDSEHRFHRLWPIGKTFAWPPGAVLQDDEIAAFSAVFDRDFGSPEVAFLSMRDRSVRGSYIGLA